MVTEPASDLRERDRLKRIADTYSGAPKDRHQQAGREAEEETPREAEERTQRKTLAVAVGLVVLIGLVALIITQVVGTSAPPPRATFDQPAKGSTVSVTQSVSGHASGLPFRSGWQLWLVIYDPGGKRYYPQQSPGPLTVRDGRFQGTAYFDPTSIGTYTMQLVLADPAGSSQFAKYITQAKATVPVKYPGLEKLPRGAQRVLDSRPVIR